LVDWHFCAVFGYRIFLNVIEFSTSKIGSFSDAESVTVSIVPGVEGQGGTHFSKTTPNTSSTSPASPRPVIRARQVAAARRVLSGNHDIAFIALHCFVFEALEVFGARGEELTLSFRDTKEIEVVGDYACHCPKCGL
jgi:hypothetical protein